MKSRTKKEDRPADERTPPRAGVHPVLVVLLFLLVLGAGALGYLVWVGRLEVQEMKADLVKVQADLDRRSREADQHTRQREKSDSRAKELESGNAALTKSLEGSEAANKKLAADLDVKEKTVANLQALLKGTDKAAKLVEKLTADLALLKENLADKTRENETKRKGLEKALEEEKARTKDLDAALKKLGSKGFSMVDDPSRYNALKSRTLLVVFREGKRDEALAIGKKLGFELAGELRPACFLYFRWAESKPITKDTLSDLRRAWRTLSVVQPHFRSATRIQARFPPGKEPDDVNGGRASNDPLQKGQWGLRAINAHQAWTSVQAAKVLVAVLDSGFDLKHPDLEESWWKGAYSDLVDKGKRPIPRTSFDANGKLDVAYVAHGTHVAGIIGARGNNSIGVAGVCWSMTEGIVPIRVTRAKEKPEDATEAGYIELDGIYEALKSKAKIINCSFAEPLNPDPDFAWQAAMEKILEKHQVLIVCAAGNVQRFKVTGKTLASLQKDKVPEAVLTMLQPMKKDQLEARDQFQRKLLRVLDKDALKRWGGKILQHAANHGEGGLNLDVEGFVYPAAFSRLEKQWRDAGLSLEGSVITVMAVDESFHPPDFSNYGVMSVDLAAPGDAILSTVPREEWSEQIRDYTFGGKEKDGYGVMSGTSQAAPFVAGAAALIWSHPNYEKFSPHELKNLILDKARKVDALKDKCGGDRGGRCLDLSFLKKKETPRTAPQPSPSTLPVRRPLLLAGISSRFFDGWRAFWVGNYREATVAFQDAIEDDPKYAGAYYYLAFSYAGMGQEKEATGMLDKALQIESRHSLRHSSNRWRDWGLLMERVQGRKRQRLSELRTQHLAGSSLEPFALEPGFWADWRPCNARPPCARPVACRGS